MGEEWALEACNGVVIGMHRLVELRRDLQREWVMELVQGNDRNR